jgi:hypothetical protein
MAAIPGQTGHPLDAERGEVQTIAETCRPRSDASRPPRRKFVAVVYRRAQPCGIGDLVKLLAIHQPIGDAIADHDRVRALQRMPCYNETRRSIGLAKPARNSFLSLDDAGALEVL